MCESPGNISYHLEGVLSAGGMRCNVISGPNGDSVYRCAIRLNVMAATFNFRLLQLPGSLIRVVLQLHDTSHCADASIPLSA